MPTINASGVTVLIICSCKPADQAEVARRAEAAMPIFARQPGFVSAALHVSEKGDQVVHYLQWQSLKDHQACQKAADWADPASGAFWAFVGEGKMKFDAQVYTVAAVSDAG